MSCSNYLKNIFIFVSLFFSLVFLSMRANDKGDSLAGIYAIEETCLQIMSREDTSTKSEEIIVYSHFDTPSLENQNNVDVVADQLTSQSTENNIRSPQTIGPVNFTSVTLADTSALPPDSDGVVGITQFLTVVNGRIRSHSKFTGIADGVLNTTLDNFFNSVRNGIRTTDPRVRFDRLTNRWFVICINVQRPGPNRLLLAVSNSAILSNVTVWNFFFLDQSAVNPPGDTGLFFDFPTLGIDNNALYIGGNQFDNNDFYINSTIFVIQKSSALGTGPLVAKAFRNLISTGGPVTPQGVTNYDTVALQGFCIGSFNNNLLSLRIISNPGSTNPTISNGILIPITPIAESVDVPALGSATPLASIGTRLCESHIRNNQLWVAHNIGLNGSGTSTGTITRTGIRWYQFNMVIPTVPLLTQSGTLFDSAPTNPIFYWMPSLLTSGQGHMALGFSAAGATLFANAGTVGRLASSPLGTLGTPVLYTSSSTSYNVQFGTSQRWGDYSVTSLDPQDNMTLWTIQEFCDATNSYGCRVAQLLAPLPAQVSSATPPLVVRGLPAVPIVINGSSVGGTGFYDPGAGFDKRLTVLVSGGVIVNSVSYINPQSVIITINTQFATPGIKTVIIKNPDGQQSSGNVLIVL